MKKKVIVGLSGGVDSSVSAKLLLDEGYDVEGLFMRNWDSNINNDFLGNSFNGNICPQEQDYNDAIQVAEKLNIKIHRVDFIKEYWDKVFEYFLEEYKKGRTPNPDILCNKFIKFDLFLKHAIEQLGADFIAMGHYAGVIYNEKNKEFELLKAVDDNKDQSYFLSELNQFQLSKTLFPLYKYTKPEVRKIASNYGLSVANKKDSTGICFIGERNFTKFLQNYIPNIPGDIIDIETNTKLGSHIGVMYYTIGQRKGLNLGGYKEPYYVAKKDIEKKILYVSCQSETKYLYSNGCLVSNFNWIIKPNSYFLDDEFTCSAKFRYRQEDVDVKVLKMDSKNLKIVFTKPLRAITEGQQAVLYLNNICIGGGIIDSVF
ncbi:tRNA 2-thiouridine(34) synthase MnmA [Spiroplasma turonicum]|uniref:tRNA 2-thiouridine(34) synthase MnmA n=1 Tax=Spiroplasma turonicum TaxID=216946 RepID=UPI0009462B1C|nr:tRNA 2-thiouridine(34) synthase MnmA [Spiroplasma turonicum]